MKTAEEALSFEEAVTQLEEIVTAMEGGTLTLEDALRRFEQAVSLSRYCAERLETAEKRIQILTAEEGLQPAPGFS